MYKTTIRLFDGAFTPCLKTAQRHNLLAVLLLLVQLGLLVYLMFTKGFAYSFVGLYLLHLLAFAFLLTQVWLYDYPHYRRHLTFTAQSINYRAGFLKKEQTFDWDEVDKVCLQPGNTSFILKNEEEHHLPFGLTGNMANLQQARKLLLAIVKQKNIFLTDTQN